MKLFGVPIKGPLYDAMLAAHLTSKGTRRCTGGPWRPCRSSPKGRSLTWVIGPQSNIQ